jgi:hypothetical protein
MRYVALWKQNGRVANNGSQRRETRSPAVQRRGKKGRLSVLRRGDAVVAVFQPNDREGFGAGWTSAKCADTVNVSRPTMKLHSKRLAGNNEPPCRASRYQGRSSSLCGLNQMPWATD